MGDSSKATACGQPGVENVIIKVSQEAFLKAVSEELISHFRWTSVEGLVELEARQVAWNALKRVRDGH